MITSNDKNVRTKRKLPTFTGRKIKPAAAVDHHVHLTPEAGKLLNKKAKASGDKKRLASEAIVKHLGRK